MRAKNVNERLGFTEDGDPIKDMGIGWNIEKEIKKRLHEIGDPMTYKDFMDEFLDRFANQDSLGVFEDLNRVIIALKEEGKHRIIDEAIDEDETFVDELINLQIKLLSKLSVEKQLEWYESVLEHILYQMKR